MRSTLFRRALFLATTALVLSACHRQYSFEQEKVELDTLGEELWKIWYKDAGRAAERPVEKSQMLVEQHNDFVDAVDVIAPDEELTAVNDFMTNLLTLVDDGILPALTRKAIIILREAAADMALLTGLASPTGPDAESFVSADVAPNLLGYLTGYPDLVPLLRFTTRIALENDGFTDEGARTFDEAAGISDIVRVLALELRDTTTSDEEPLAVTVRDLTLVEDPAYASQDPTAPAYVALFDSRGYPLPAQTADGSIGFPFTDADNDGLADVDANGEFILSDGMTSTIRPFATPNEATIDESVTRDAFGRAIGPSGPVFEYVDLNRTALGFIVRQQHRLSSQDALYDLLQAFRLIMGQKQVYTDEIGGYEGYTQEQPLMEMSHALLYAMDNPGTADFLQGTSELAKQHPQVLANLFWAVDNMVDIMNASPSYEMTDNETMAYDALPLVREIAEDPALWADVMAAFRDPITRRSGQAFATMLRYTDSDSVPAKDGPYDSCFKSCESSFDIGTTSRFDCIRSCPMDEIFNEPIDYSQPESMDSNSCFQKMQHLLRDAQGHPYEMSIDNAAINGDPLPVLPPLLRLDASGEAFMASVAGNLNLENHVPPELWDSEFGDLLELLGVESGNVAAMISAISELFGAHLDVVPTPGQITRLFNQPDIKFETTEGNTDVLLDPADPVCKDGFVMSKHYAYVLYQAEAAGAVDTLYPLAKAFSDHGREDLILRLLNVFHDHYSSNPTIYKTKAGAQSPMKGANLRSYEPAMLELFEKGELFEALNDFAVAQKQVEDATGIPMTESLRQFLLKGLQPGFRNHIGEDFVNINDGRTIPNASAFHHLFRAIDEAATRLDPQPEVKEKFDDSVAAFMKVMTGTKRDPGAPARFDDAGSVAFAAQVTEYLADEVREKQDRGELTTWINQDLLPMMEEFWRGRMLAAFIDLADEALAEEADQIVLNNFLTYLFGTPEGRTHALVAAHQLLVQSIARDRWLPTAQFLSRVIDPDRTWQTEPYGPVSMVSLTMLMLKKTLDADPNNTGIFLIHRGLDRPLYGDAPFTIIIDVIARYFSPNPAAETFESANDYQVFFTEMGDYLSDDVHGMERLYELVDRRIKPAEQASDTPDFNE